MWHVIIPLKDWAGAKSRIALPPAVRRALAQAMAIDTIHVVKAARGVARVIVVTTSPAMRTSPGLAAADVVLVQPPGDLNDASSWATQHSVPARAPVAALMADLPALTSPSLDAALDAAEFETATFVADRHGDGTTLLTALSSETFQPSFGTDSARRHVEQGATALPSSAVAPALACDVDTLDDLAAAGRIGLNQRTSRVVQSLGLAAGSLGSRA